MIINHGTINGDRLVLSPSKGFSIKLNTQEKYKSLDELAKINMAYQSNTLTEADFKAQDDVVIFYADLGMEISHFNTNLRCFEVKYSEDRHELMIIGKADPYSATLPTINVFKKLDGRYYQESFRIQFIAKDMRKVIRTLGVKPVILTGKRRDGYMLVSPKSDKVLMNTSMMTRLLVVPPGITEDQVRKALRCTFKEVQVVTSDKLDEYTKKHVTQACYFYGYDDIACRRAKMQAQVIINKLNRNATGHAPHHVNQVTGQLEDETETGEIIVTGQIPVDELPDGEPESMKE